MVDRTMSSASGPVYFIKKRERTQNWIPEEKSTLLALIKKHILTLENRRLDTSATAQKNIAWEKVYRDFRQRFTAERDITKIKAQWSRMKSQARTEMHTFAAKAKKLGSEEASKHAPSDLSVKVWRLLQNLRKNDTELDRSDESSQDAEVASDVEAFLDKLHGSNHPEMNFPEIKTEPIDEFYQDDSAVGNEVRNPANNRKRNSVVADWQDNSIEAIAQKRNRLICETNTFHNSDVEIEERDKENPMVSLPPDNYAHPEISVDHATWMFEAAQREHQVKMRMLSVELERAEFDKQKALTELKTSELKKKMIEEEAAASRESQARTYSGEAGSGAGQGGGGGGTIRSAGGSFGKMEAAKEDQYFYNLQKEQIENYRKDLHCSIGFHEEQIKRHEEQIKLHQEAIQRNKKTMGEDRQLMKMLKEKTEEEVAAMRAKVRVMTAKIEDYNRDINETVRFLKGLENDLSADSKKKA